MPEGYLRLIVGSAQQRGRSDLPTALCLLGITLFVCHRSKALHQFAELHASGSVRNVGVTSILFNKYNRLSLCVTPVTRVTPNLEGYVPPLPGSINPTSELQEPRLPCAGGPLRFSLRHGAGNPRDCVRGKVHSLVNR